MPESNLERAVFGCMMALAMVYGMEVYNVSLHHDGLATISLNISPASMLGLSALVVILQELVGGPLARRAAARLIDLRTASPLQRTFVIGTCTVLCMCPLMSLLTLLLFQGASGNVAARWLRAFAFNFPMAFFWQLVVAGPLVRFVFRSLFPRSLPQQTGEQPGID